MARASTVGPLLPLAVLCGALAAASACGRGPDVERAFVPDARVQLRMEGDEAWRTGLVGTLGECRVVFVSPSPVTRGPRRYVPVYPDDITELRVRGPVGAESARADTAGAEWIDVDAREVRRRFGGCDPFG